MEKISISKSAKKIQVNDMGEYIIVDARDQDFVAGFLELLQDFEAKKPEYQKRMEEIQNMPCATNDELLAKGLAACRVNKEICEELKSKVNDIFKEDACRKIFGNITPSVMAFAEFFEQLSPIVKNAQAEQYENIKKYTDKYEK